MIAALASGAIALALALLTVRVRRIGSSRAVLDRWRYYDDAFGFGRH